MSFRFKKSRATILTCLVVLIGAFVGYRTYLSATTIVIWGEFRVPKSQFTLARIDTVNGTTVHAFEVHNPQLVLQIAQEVSHMKRQRQITATNFPPSESHNSITKLVIVTRKYGSAGGNFWSVPGGSGIWQDADGYYWAVPKELIATLEQDIQSAGVTKLF